MVAAVQGVEITLRCINDTPTTCGTLLRGEGGSSFAITCSKCGAVYNVTVAP